MGQFDFGNTINLTITPVVSLYNDDRTSATFRINTIKSIAQFFGGIYSPSMSLNTNWQDICTFSSSDLPTLSETKYVDFGHQIIGDKSFTSRIKLNTDGTMTLQMKAYGNVTSQVYFNFNNALIFYR